MAYEFETKTVELLAGYVDENNTKHEEVEIREMTGVDEEDIQKADVRSNIGRIVTKLLSNCVVRVGTIEKSKTKAAKWEEIMKSLFLGDRDLIMMEIRKLTYGEDVEVPFKCPSCKGEGKHILDWDEIELEPVVGDPLNISFELKKGARTKEGGVFKEGTLRLPNGQDQELLDSIARKNMGQANTSLLTRIVKNIGEVKLSSNTFKNLVAKDRDALLEVVSEHTFGPNFKIEIDCPHCGERFDHGVHPVNFL